MYKANEEIREKLAECPNVAVLMDNTTIDELLCLLDAFETLCVINGNCGISIHDFHTLRNSTTDPGGCEDIEDEERPNCKSDAKADEEAQAIIKEKRSTDPRRDTGRSKKDRRTHR